MTVWDPARQVPTGTQTPLRTRWNHRALVVVSFLALLPPAALALQLGGAAWLSVFAVALLVTLLAQWVFAAVRRRPLPIDGPVAALAFAIIVPPDMPLWQVALAMAFGAVAGQQVFGGRGLSFLNPAVVALGFLMFSFTGTRLTEPNLEMAGAVLPGAALLIVAGLLSVRFLLGALIGLGVTVWLIGAGNPLAALATGGFVYALVFLAGDASASASTEPGRWVHGLLFGGLAVLFSAGNGIAIEPVVFAALLGSVLAPLIDQAVIAVHVWRREQRRG